MRNHSPTPAVLGLLICTCAAALAQSEKDPAGIYVPYKDLAAVVDPAAKTVLMDRQAFAKLLAAAEANAAAADSIELGQVTQADYAAQIKGAQLTLTGTLTVESLSDKPVRVPLGFGRIGLTEVSLDGSPAPLGYDEKGKLLLIVAGKGAHQLTVAASAGLKELSGGGMSADISLPPAVAGKMTLTAPGDLEVNANVPVASSTYDKQADRTTAELPLGGQGTLTLALIGNGRLEDENAILLGESTTTVSLDKSHQLLHCAYSVQILRRGVRRLEFTLPIEWTVTDVASPNLVKWSIVRPVGEGLQTLHVQFRSPARGSQVVHLAATAAYDPSGNWPGPQVNLLGAAFQRGYLIIDPGQELRVRREQLRDARREDAAVTASASRLMPIIGSRLYYHWGERWSVNLNLATVALRRSSQERQSLSISAEELSLEGSFEITAIGKEFYDASFILPAGDSGWDVSSVTVNDKREGFEYKVAESDDHRVLKIDLPGPVPVEGTAKVAISLRSVPAEWDFSAYTAERKISFPLIRSQAEKTSGLISVTPKEDLDSSVVLAPEMLQPVTVGRMALLGLSADVQSAYSYEAPIDGQMELLITRRQPRLAAQSVGLISAEPTRLTAQWRITYTVSRARAKTLYLLAAKSLGQEIMLETPGRRITSKSIISPGPQTVPLPDALAEAYNLWQIILDGQTIGDVLVRTSYEQALPPERFQVPLIRPIGVAQSSEVLAVQAGEELALAVHPVSTGDVDAVDLPPLPGPAQRLLAAFSLQAPNTPAGAQAAVALETTVHDQYAIPPALALSVNLTTYLDRSGAQRTQADFDIVNAGLQFLTIRLPQGAQLWSVRLGSAQAKPKRNAAGDYLVPLALSTSPQPVRVVYAWPAQARREHSKNSGLQMGGVSLPGVQINQMHWLVFPPPGYCITSQKTHMQTDQLLRTKPAYLQTLRYAGEMAGGFALTPASYMAAGRALRAVDELAERLPEAQMFVPSGESKDTSAEQRAVQFKPGTLPAKGRYTLPVELTPTPGAGPAVSFSALGQSDLVVGLSSTSIMKRWWLLGAALVAAAGILRLASPPKDKAVLIIAVLAGASVLAIWSAAAAPLANGAFLAALCLIPFYLLVGIVRWIGRKLGQSPAVRSPATAVLLAICLISIAGSTLAAAEASPAPVSQPDKSLVIIPYQGDPAKADQAPKVLIPYRRFVELWNLAHPDEPIETPPAETSIALAGVKYAAVVSGDRMTITLTAQVRTFGRGWIVLPMPFENLAVTEATLDGEPAQLQVQPKGMVLTLPGGISGSLRITTVTTPEFLGPRASVRFTLPPLPAAAMTILLPDKDLILEAPGLDGVPTSRPLDESVEWTIALGDKRDISLRWSPQAGAGLIDRTLTARADHHIYVHHWSIRGTSKFSYAFSSGQHDRFALLLPAEATVTELTGTNLRDFSIVAQRTLEGSKFNVLEVRLNRPASKTQELTVHWLSDLPPLDKPFRLLLPRAAEVGRESGTVALHAAGGMTVKTAEVTGGRRDRIDEKKAALPAADATELLARYYWPYRPFALSLRLSRPVMAPEVGLDQLVRISADRIQLLVEAKLNTSQIRLFGCHFTLPDGYELLSAAGPAVDDWYVQPTPTGRHLHISFSSGVTQTSVALVLVRDKPKLGTTGIPTVTMVDPDGKPLEKQTGRLAVQVAPSLEAQTVGSENLKPINPSLTRDWLDQKQVLAVQFAYSYEQPPVVLDLAVRRQETRVNLETFTALTVQPTSVWYTYRLRYDIQGSPLDRVSFTLPTSYASLVEVTSPALRSVATEQQDERTRWTVSLVNEVTGVLDVAVNFSLPIDPATTELLIPRIGIGPQNSCRAIIALQNDSRHELTVKDSKNLTVLPIGEQRKMLSESVLKSLQFVFQSYRDDWSLSLGMTAAKPAKRIQAVVDLLALTTVIDRNGHCRYEAKLALQNRSEQFLRIRLPEPLELWSATVAGQPVKPVTPAGAGEILIPLIKTSPGGLPYEVKLYFAGQALSQLDNLKRLKPPGISIIGTPVIRTTWSLSLPDGYWYVRPGGNVSKVAGQAESMIVATEAKLDQLKRLGRTYRELGSYGSARQQEVAQRNWDIKNAELAEELRQAERFVTDNRIQVGDKDFSRLQGMVQEQRLYREQEARQMSQLQQDEAVRSSSNVNVYTNDGSSNHGFAEQRREEGLNTLPEFVLSNNRWQKEAAAGRLAEIKAQKQPLVRTKARWSARTPGKAGDLDYEADRPADALEVTGGADLAPELEEKLQGQMALQDRNIARMDSYYAKARGGAQAAEPAPTPEPDGKKLWVGGSHGAAKPAEKAPGRSFRMLGEDAESADASRDEADIQAGLPAASAVAPGWAHVAKGTFSLPVELPQGAIRLDFARPGGEPELTIWAVRSSLVKKASASLGVLIGLLILSVLLKMLSRIRLTAGMPASYIAAYVVLALLLLAFAGFLGLFAWLLVVIVVEALRRRYRPSSTAG